jgi:hypothetical protein
MMINLDKYEERSLITSDSLQLNWIELNWSVEDKYLSEASLHPQKDLNWWYPFPDNNSSPAGWFELAKVITQSA